MNPWLMKFGIGGVQEFISQSRKTRDLAAGSELIQHTSKNAAASAKAMGADVILPQEPDLACPHQLVLRWPNADEDQVRNWGLTLIRSVMDYWEKEANEVTLKNLVSGLNKGFKTDPTLISLQIKDALQLFWVAVPINGDYLDAFREVQRCYDLRRFSRTFIQPERPANPLGTCAQCGIRNAVLDPPRICRHNWFDAHDKLCGVCLAKRYWSFKKLTNCEKYPSTVGLARNRFFRLPEYKNHLQILEKHGIAEDDVSELLETEKWKNLAEDEKEKLVKATRTRDYFSSYYVALLFDGDEMGKWFSGEFFRTGQDLESGQKILSKALADFTRKIRDVHFLQACLVYLGGDDGLVLLPLDFLFPFIRVANMYWVQCVQQDSKIKALALENHKPTLSLHAAVIHESAPFQRVIAALHPSLEITKTRGGRNVLSISISPRSGTESMAFFSWNELENIIASIEAFSTWRMNDQRPKGIGCSPTKSERTIRRETALPSRLPYVLLDGLVSFFDKNGKISDPITEKAFGLELARLLKRRDDKTNSQALSRLTDWLTTRLRPPSSAAVTNPITPWGHFATALEINAFLARELDWRNEEEIHD